MKLSKLFKFPRSDISLYWMEEEIVFWVIWLKITTHWLFTVVFLKEKLILLKRKIFFQILWKSRCDILVSFPSYLKKITFCTKILTWKVELWIFSLEKKHGYPSFISNWHLFLWHLIHEHLFLMTLIPKDIYS